MGNERRSIEDEDKVSSLMQLVQEGGQSSEEAVADGDQQLEFLNPHRSSVASNRRAGNVSGSLIEDEEEQKNPAPPALDKLKLRGDVSGARALAEAVGATPGRNWTRFGEILQGGANPARRRGEGSYGAAALEGVADLVVEAGVGEAGSAAGGELKTLAKGITSAAPLLKVAKDAGKYTVGNLVSTAGQAAQKIGDDKRKALDPLGKLEEQRLIDLANRHEHGIDMTSTEQGLARNEDVAARGVRFETKDKAKKQIWEGPKKRTWGRIALNGLLALPRGAAKAVKSLVTSPAEGVKSATNFFAKYGRKFGNWVSNNPLSRKRRANKALARIRRRADANADLANAVPNAPRLGRRGQVQQAPQAAAPDATLKADSPIGKHRFLNFRGADAAIRSHTRDVKRAQGFDNILGQKDYETLSEADRKEYRAKEMALLRIRLLHLGYGHAYLGYGHAPDPEQNQGAEPVEDGFEQIDRKMGPDLGTPELPKDSHPGMSAAKGIDKGVSIGEKLLETSKKLDMPVGAVTDFMGKNIPDMLDGQALEDYAPTAESAKAVGKSFKEFNTNVETYRTPLIGKAAHTAFDLMKTAKQYKHRNDDPHDTAKNERRALEDTREMSDRVRALLQAKKDAGASKESIATTKRLRNKLLMINLVNANRKLARAQEMNGITPLNEYTKKESDFVRTGEFKQDVEAGAKGPKDLGKELGQSTLKMLKGMVPVGGANRADDTNEENRVYGEGGKKGYLERGGLVRVAPVVNAGIPDAGDGNASRDSIIEDEDKFSDDDKSYSSGPRGTIAKSDANESDSENLPHLSQGSGSGVKLDQPGPQRPSVDFNVDDDEVVNESGQNGNQDEPELVRQMRELERADVDQAGPPRNRSASGGDDAHASGASDGTTFERLGSFSSDDDDLVSGNSTEIARVPSFIHAEGDQDLDNPLLEEEKVAR